MFNNSGCNSRQNEFNQNFTGDNNEINMDIDVSMANNSNMQFGGMSSPMMGQQPIMEPIQERVVNRTIMHEVPHV